MQKFEFMGILRSCKDSLKSYLHRQFKKTNNRRMFEKTVLSFEVENFETIRQKLNKTEQKRDDVQEMIVPQN